MQFHNLIYDLQYRGTTQKQNIELLQAYFLKRGF